MDAAGRAKYNLGLKGGDEARERDEGVKGSARRRFHTDTRTYSVTMRQKKNTKTTAAIAPPTNAASR